MLLRKSALIWLVMIFIMMSVNGTSLAKSMSGQTKPTSSLIKLNINGQFVDYAHSVSMVKDRIMIPANSLRMLNASVGWSQSAKKITIKKGSQSVSMKLGEQGTVMKNGKFFIQAKSLSAIKGVSVEYEGLRNILFITDRSYKPDLNVINSGNLVDARKAVLSLPLRAKGFQPWKGLMKISQLYSFKKGEALRYMFTSYYESAPFQHILTIVEVKDGRAYVIYQEETHVMDYEGAIKNQGDPTIMNQFNVYGNEFTNFSIDESKTTLTNYSLIITDIAGETRTDGK